MGKMELKEATRVFTSDGKEVGRINRFVLDPATNEVTHIVVQKGWLFSEDKAVPFEMVNVATEDMMVLSENIHSFNQLPPFEAIHYIRAHEADVGWPRRETTRNIPEHTIPLKEGTDVMSSDGEHVGDIERLFVASDSNKATHFVISQGVFFKDRKLIPTHWVKSVEEDKVELAVLPKLLEDLPRYEAQ